MPQLFHRSANTLARVSILGVLLLALGAFGAMDLVNRSPYNTGVGVAREQPVPFSHQHHVSGLGIDCRYCHTGVEKSAFAGIPPTATCMNCHKQIWTNAELLAPVRNSYATGERLKWRRIHNVPNFVQFDHSIHINKGIGCVSCHGRVDQMPLMMKAEPMTMSWCLNCHRHPEKFVRPKSEVFNMAWKAPNQEQLGAQLVKQYHIRSRIRCSTCHY
ncbi:MAG: cytochrome c3 family protein [Acidobacteriota bacterium]